MNVNGSAAIPAGHDGLECRCSIRIGNLITTQKVCPVVFRRIHRNSLRRQRAKRPLALQPSELLARIAALIRRIEKRNRTAAKSFSFDDVEIDSERAEVSRAGRKISLAAKEPQLLEYLLPSEEILQKVEQYNSEVNSRTVDVHVAWLRQKLDNPQSPRHIQTVRGKGYKFIS